jgi:hypothetical protein
MFIFDDKAIAFGTALRAIASYGGVSGNSLRGLSEWFKIA